MEIKKEDGKIITTMTFSECFFGYDDFELSKRIINKFDDILSYPYQPERLSGLESEMTMRQSEPDNERSGVIQK